MRPLITPAQLRALLAERQQEVTVLDVRYRMGGPAGLAEFAAGHIPGATYLDLDAALASAPGDGGRHPLPGVEEFEAAMRRAGVSGSVPVVVYDDWGGHAAARAWWLLTYHGHPDVRVLDGAWPAWLTAVPDLLETGAGAVPRPGDFQSRPGRRPVVSADDVPEVPVLVDARAPERYRGESEPVDPVAGHIPGAVNLPSAGNLTPGGEFLDPAMLRERYAAHGAVPGAQVAVYCGSGVTAAHDVLALELCGVEAALYPGSWSEWIRDPSRPVERG